MLKVSQNNENHCATFCGKPVETVETVEKRASAQGMDLAEFRCAPYGKALKRHSSQKKIKLDKTKKG